MSATVATDRVFNFSAGPAVLPVPVLEEIQRDLLALPGVGSSVMEISHRSAPFLAICADARERLVDLLGVPASHEVLFLQGGARLQNTMIPMNLLVDPEQTADYLVTGSWGRKSADEVRHFGKLHVPFDGKGDGYRRVPGEDEIAWASDAAYAHYTSNETIQGVQFHEPPKCGVPLVCDQSSDFLSRPVDVSRFGLIYACAQKNAGIAGVTVVIIDRELMARGQGRLPGYLSYQDHADNDSMYNTPPTFAIYVTGLVCKWIQETVGGLDAMAALNREKSRLLYDILDEFPEFYVGHAERSSRSDMNVVFRLPDADQESEFLSQAAKAGLTSLKGHRSVGGIRASIYNAMPLGGVENLAQFMRDFVARSH